MALFLLVFLVFLAAPSPLLPNLCPQPQVHRFLLLSEAHLERARHIRFRLTLFDSPVVFNRTAEGVVLRGNFSRLVLLNRRTKSETVFEGREMQFRVPAHHVFSLQKIPDLEVLITHELVAGDEDSPIRHLLLSQTYASTPFTSSVNTVLSQHLHSGLEKGDLLRTAQVVKLLQGFPMLLYRGGQDSFPCRNDLFCLLKREYQLVSPEDLAALKAFLLPGTVGPLSKKAFKRKTLTEIYPQEERVVERQEERVERQEERVVERQEREEL